MIATSENSLLHTMQCSLFCTSLPIPRRCTYLFIVTSICISVIWFDWFKPLRTRFVEDFDRPSCLMPVFNVPSSEATCLHWGMVFARCCYTIPFTCYSFFCLYWTRDDLLFSSHWNFGIYSGWILIRRLLSVRKTGCTYVLLSYLYCEHILPLILFGFSLISMFFFHRAHWTLSWQRGLLVYLSLHSCSSAVM